MSLNTKKLFTLLITLLIMLQPIAIFGDDTKTTTIKYEVKAHISYIGIDKETELFSDDLSVGDSLDDLHIEDVPRIEGKVFVGWYIDLDDEDTLVLEGTIVDNHMTLYAKYLDSEDIKGRIKLEYGETSDYIASIDGYIDDRDLTDIERKHLAQGGTLTFVLNINNVDEDNIDVDRKQLLDESISRDKNLLLNYLDISLIDETKEKTKEELHNPITITLTIPEEDYASNRIYTIYGINSEGVSVILFSDKADINHQVSFSVSRFYDITNYVLSYRKKHHPDPYVPIQTGIDYIDMPITNNPVIRLSLCLFLLISLSLTYLYSKKGDKK